MSITYITALLRRKNVHANVINKCAALFRDSRIIYFAIYNIYTEYSCALVLLFQLQYTFLDFSPNCFQIRGNFLKPKLYA